MSERGIEITKQEFVDFAVSSPLFPRLTTEPQARLIFDALVKKGWIIVDGERFRRIREITRRIPKPPYFYLSLEPWKDEIVKNVEELKKAFGESKE